MNKRLVITGGAGFIGANAVRRALADGHRVTVIDNLFTGFERNLDEVRDRIEFVQHDVVDPLPDLDCDAVLHLACPASPPHYQRDPVYTWETAVLGTRNVIRFAVEQSARVLIASTSEVYGDPAVTPQPETYRGNVNPVGERACYDEGKRAGETYANDMRRTRGGDIRIARIFNTYGPWMDPDDGRVVSNFICQALRGEPLTIYGEGQQTRSFCFVDDLVDGLFRLLWHDQPVPFPVNLGNPDERTIASLADVLEEVFDRPLPVVYKPLPADDPVRRRPDISRAQALLDWVPGIPLQDGLRQTVAWFRERLAAGAS